jgi:hypothetical protein
VGEADGSGGVIKRSPVLRAAVAMEYENGRVLARYPTLLRWDRKGWGHAVFVAFRGGLIRRALLTTCLGDGVFPFDKADTVFDGVHA